MVSQQKNSSSDLTKIVVIIIPSYQPPEAYKNLNIYRLIKLHIICNCSCQGQCKPLCGQIQWTLNPLLLLGLPYTWLLQDILGSFIHATFFSLEFHKVPLLFLLPPNCIHLIILLSRFQNTRYSLYYTHYFPA